LTGYLALPEIHQVLRAEIKKGKFLIFLVSLFQPEASKDINSIRELKENKK